MTPAHHQQHTWTHTEAGTYLVRAVCASAPAVVNDDTQDRPGNRAGFFIAIEKAADADADLRDLEAEAEALARKIAAKKAARTAA